MDHANSGYDDENNGHHDDAGGCDERTSHGDTSGHSDDGVATSRAGDSGQADAPQHHGRKVPRRQRRGTRRIGNTGDSGAEAVADDPQVAALAGVAAGPGLAAALAGVDIAVVSARDLVVVLKARARQKAFDDAQVVRLMAELTGRPEYQTCSCPVDVIHSHHAIEPAGDEISLALAWTPARGKHQAAVALELTTDLTATLTALETGLIDAEKATLIADRTRCLPTPELRQTVEATVLTDIKARTRTQLDYQLRQAVIAADPAGAERRRAAAARDRRVSRPEPLAPGGDDGTARMELTGPAEDLIALWTAVDAAARHARDQERANRAGAVRTLDQLRFDILTGLGWTALNLGHLGCCNISCTTAKTANSTTATATVTRVSDRGEDPPRPDVIDKEPSPSATVPSPSGAFPATAAGAIKDQAAAMNRERAEGQAGPRLARRRGKAATVHVTVAASTLFGADEQPGWLDGFGPITAEASRRISGEGPWHRLLTDPQTHQLLEYGHTTYTPPPELTTFITARDVTCRFPTCHHPASDAEIDHIRPYEHGGTTETSNTWTLHRGHHLGKTHHNHTITIDADGTAWWTTPAGHTYPTDPETIGPFLHHPTPPNTEPAPF